MTPAKHAAKDTAKNAQTDRDRRVEQERSGNDPKHMPTEKDAQIDGSGARFKSDG